MASTSKCPYCGGTVRSDEKNCPHCGAANELYVADTPRVITAPQTIAELQEYCAERGMPLLRMRFFIGENYQQPKAFGIYQDGENFVVYKNKADGSRSIRYAGPDEAYAVNELYLKLLDECHRRGVYPDGNPPSGGSGGTRSGGSGSRRSSGSSGGGKGAAKFLLYPVLIPVFYLAARYIVPLALVLGVAVVITLLLRWIGKRGRELPSGQWGVQEDRPLEKPVTVPEYLGFAFRWLFFRAPSTGLSYREQKVKGRVDIGMFRFIVSAVLALGLIFACRGFLHRNDGYYLDRAGDIYYHYGSRSIKTSGHSDFYALDDGSGYELTYLGDDWNADWGGFRYTPPTIWSDIEDSAVNYSSGSHSGSHDSDWDSWDSDDTDWDSDW